MSWIALIYSVSLIPYLSLQLEGVAPLVLTLGNEDCIYFQIFKNFPKSVPHLYWCGSSKTKCLVSAVAWSKVGVCGRDMKKRRDCAQSWICILQH